jgi:peptide/nickel transport system ATP-binding protein
MSKILDIKELSLSLMNNPPQILVDNISFHLNAGQILGIVGESGSGKSLTALSITSLLPENIKITGGEILFSEKGKTINLQSLNINKLRNYRGRKISMIFQEPMTSLNPSMVCGKQVEEGIRAHFDLTRKERRENVLNLFREVLLPRPEELYDAYPHQLSGGQRQRVMIALALCANPEIIIADEPTTALDVTVQKNILDLLKNLRLKRGLSVIFISHDLRLIKDLADEVVVMRKGRIVEKDTVQNLFHLPSHPYTRGLMACLPPLDKKPLRLLTIQDFEERENPISEKEVQKRPEVFYNEEPLLRIQNLSVDYLIPGGVFSFRKTKFKALDNLSFEVFRGETLGLVGESGCGKTTIGKTILRLIQGSEGDIWYKGKKISALKGKELRRFRKSAQVVFQDPFSSLNPKHTVLNMLDEAIKVHHPGLNFQKRLERISELLIQVGLSNNDMHKYPHEFSGGQRQRLSIARSLAPEPEFLVLDESVSALDVSVQAQILNLLNDLKSLFGLTYIFISHDLSIVKYMSDRIVVMNEGRMEETDLSEEIFKSPKKEYTRRLLNAIPGYQYSS